MKKLFLFAGVLCLPVVFAWFTLREGYGFWVRFISILWMMFFASMISEIDDTAMNMAGAGLKSSQSVEGSDGGDKKSGDEEPSPRRTLWRIGSYVDEFGDRTNKKFLSYADYFVGVFSNSATENSPLFVEFLVNSKNEINIILHEYQKNSPVKEYDSVKYIVSIKTSKGKETLTGWNSSDRIKLGPQSSLKLHNHWINNEIIGFSIRKSDGLDTLTRYSFKMKNYPGYKETYAKLK